MRKVIVNVSLSETMAQVLDALAKRMTSGNRSALVEHMLTQQAMVMLAEQVDAIAESNPNLAVRRRSSSSMQAVLVPQAVAVPTPTEGS